MPEAHLNVGGCAIIVVVCNSVSDHKAFQIRLEHGAIISILCVVLVDAVTEPGHIDAGV